MSSKCFLCHGLNGKCDVTPIQQASEEDIKWFEFGINLFVEEQADIGKQWQTPLVARHELLNLRRDVSNKRFIAKEDYLFVCKRCITNYLKWLPDYGLFKGIFGKDKDGVLNWTRVG